METDLLSLFQDCCFAAFVFGGMGGADIELMVTATLVLQKNMAAISVGLTAMLIFHAIWYIRKRLRGMDEPKAYPLAPFLSLGCLAAYFNLRRNTL